MNNFVRGFLVSGLMTFLIPFGLLVIWVLSTSIDEPSDADGLGFAIVYGLFGFGALGIVVGLVGGLLFMALQNGE
ncbi:hypothetical protein [Priestia koreensis]|uniref:hypothetical protein n=1 Tax=Priestia koreensis TaxID=284581 RepID=UPI0028F6F809|nr:hypothetical protein [Priestia koreensis]